MVGIPTDNSASPQDVGAIADMMRWLPGLFQIVAANATGDATLTMQRSLAQYRPTLLSPAEMSEALRRGTLNEEQWRGVLARLGYSNGAQDVLRSLVPALLDAGSTQELLRRGEIPYEVAADNLRRLGYDDNNVAAILSLRLYVPGPQDVVTFAVREVYSPAVAERFGQYENFPDAALPDFARSGIDDATARKYWAAHWTLPSTTQGFEMFQRDAETGVTEDDLRKLLRAADVMPFWQDKLIAISYSPLTRVDIRRMHKAGVLDRAQVVRAYRDIGYNAERAEQLTVFTEKLNGATGDAELAPFRATIRTHAQSLYLDGILDDAELRDHLAATGITDAEVSAYVAEAQFIKHAAAQKVIREAVRVAYVGGHLTAEDATARLAADGYDSAQAAEMMVTWHVLRELRVLSAHEHAERDLTKSDILGAFEDGIIAEPEAQKLLVDMKYSDHEADVLLRRATLKMTRAQRTTAEHTHHSLFIARREGRAEASKGMVEAGVSPERIELLLTDWTHELAARAPTLTKAEVGHAVKDELLTPQEGVQRLSAMGYAPDDVHIIISLATKGTVDV